MQFCKLNFLLLLFFPIFAQAQITDSIVSRVVLDTEVVVAAKRGFDIEKYIDIIQADTVFEQAFHRLRVVNYKSNNDFSFFSKKGKKKASYHSHLVQVKDSNCVEMELLSEKSTGNYYKRTWRNKKKNRYYTAKMFERLFYKKGKHCITEKSSTPSANKSRMEKYISQLKKLIYNPGKEVNIPLIGHKTAIFDKKMIPYYDFKIQVRRYKDTPCYVFTATVKPNTPSKKTVIKHLEMWMDASSLGIISKKYHLETSNILFNFNIKMDVDLIKTKQGIVPSRISYDGAWKAPTKQKEIAQFLLEFYY